jgi:hypothetical protein
MAWWIEKSIKDFANSDENSLRNENNEIAWGEPLIGFSPGDDPLYVQLKLMIGDFYWVPVEIFRLTFPETEVKPENGDLWVLPPDRGDKGRQSEEKALGSERWVRREIQRSLT